jgi:hypothetical protein
MANKEIEIGDEVEANRDIPGKEITKGTKGIVEFIINIQSEIYYDVRLLNAKMIETSSENCWDKITSNSSNM